MGVHGEGVHAANIGVRYVPYFQAVFPMSFRWTQIKVKPPTAMAAPAAGFRMEAGAAEAAPSLICWSTSKSNKRVKNLFLALSK